MVPGRGGEGGELWCSDVTCLGVTSLHKLAWRMAEMGGCNLSVVALLLFPIYVLTGELWQDKTFVCIEDR